MSKCILALDVGGSSVKSALVEAGPRLVNEVSVDTIQSQGSSAEILNTLAAIVRRHLQNYKEVRRIAFAFPGPFDYEGGICLIQNQDKYDALYGLNISANLKKILAIPHLEFRYRNDAEAAILGEAFYGAGVPYSRLIGLTLGTGLGSAFVADQRVVTEGANIPHHGWLYSIPFGAPRADDVFSTRGLLARLRGYGVHAADIASALHGPEEDTPAFAEAFSSFGSDLGAFLKPFISDFGAEAILITGGIAEAWDRFAPSLAQSISVALLKGTLGRGAALLGAAALYF
ncbi:MAG TPA: ROK family protein [Anaerolineales bacterium]|jgi:glucokinase|nr:ROK family protein [Anaerolineales bacterium]